MIVITAHNMMDFDALGSMVAAQKLYPESRLCFGGMYARDVQNFMALNKDIIDIQNIQWMNIQNVEKLVVVDTADPKKLKNFEELLVKPGLNIEIYDHHPAMPGDLEGSFKQVEPVGAASTLLTERLKEAAAEGRITLSAFEATVIALGIYADTGCMLYDSTTTRDVAAVLWLLEQGARLDVIQENIESRLDKPQMQVFQQCLATMKTVSEKGAEVLLCSARTEKRVAGLNVIIPKLFEIDGAEAIFLLAEDAKGVEIVGRSASPYVDVLKILKPLGGRGHVAAASVNLKKKTVEEAMPLLRKSMAENIRSVRRASDIMSKPVKTLQPFRTLEEADGIMLRYGHSGMPIMDEDGRLIGMISRRDVDKARMHGLIHAPVKGFMSSNLIQAGPDTSVEQLQELIVSHDVGRIPIVEDGKLLGIVSRTDILREVYQKEQSKKTQQEAKKEPAAEENYTQLMEKNLSPEVLQFMRRAGEIARDNGQLVYVIGGFVRDLLLGVPNQDVDFVVEGNGRLFAEKAAEALGGELCFHDGFQTANLTLLNGKSVDIVTARAEYYEYPAALPTVERSCIREDLYRRDFTINAMAICLNPEEFGNLIDFFGGRRDLENKKIRVLYHFSFIEDPTRIMRAVRFAKRYHFEIEEDTWKFAQEALKRGMMTRLSIERFWHEIMLILREENPAEALEELHRLHILTDVMPDMEQGQSMEQIFGHIREAAAWWEAMQFAACPTEIVYVMSILLLLPAERRQEIGKKLSLRKQNLQEIEKAGEWKEWLSQTTWQTVPFSEIDRKLHGASPALCVYCMAKVHEDGRSRLRQYFLKRRTVQPVITGKTLKDMGLKPGAVFTEILEKIYAMYLDGLLQTPEEEQAFAAWWMSRADAQKENGDSDVSAV